MMIRTITATLLLTGAAFAERPNILLILADDMGYADLGIQGCTQFKTPNIDSIAKSGARFKQGYVSNSVCAPSRAGLLSGRIDIGFEANLPDDPEIGLDPQFETMADMLKRAGYATSCIGKWHLGEAERFYPTNRGFDYFCGLRKGSRSYFYEADGNDAPGSNAAIEINGTPVKFKGYLTDYLTDHAIGVIQEHTAATPDQPFFMFLSYTAPHAPMHSKPGSEEPFANIKNPMRRTYAAMTVSLDDGIGRVFQCLEKLGLKENTLVVFLSDNGGPTFKNGSDNGPLRDRKGSVWEGGLRVPFLMQWPARIPAGQVRDDQIISLDLLPTFAAAAGVEPVEKAFGVNLLPYLTEEGKTLGERTFFWRRDHMTDLALRSGPFKWIENRTRNEVALYNLDEDIGEKNNLIQQYPEMAEKLRATYMKWEAVTPEPTFKSGWTPEKERQKQKEQEAYLK